MSTAQSLWDLAVVFRLSYLRDPEYKVPLMNIECTEPDCGWRGRSHEDHYPSQVIDDSMTHADMEHDRPALFDIVEVDPKSKAGEGWYKW